MRTKCHLRILSIASSLILTTACGKKTESEATKPISESTNVSNTQAEKTEKAEDLSATSPQSSNISYKQSRKTALEFGVSGEIRNLSDYVSNLNKRKITVTIKGRALDNGVLSCKDLSVQDYRDNSGDKVSFTNDGTFANLDITIDTKINNFEHTYSCGIYEDGKLLDDSKMIFTFYRDLLVDSSYAKKISAKDLGLSEGNLNKIGALVITPNSTLITNGTNLQISAEEVVATRNSRIKTFSEEEETAADNMAGKNGGNITIKTAFSAGELNVEMRGQKGGRITTRPVAINFYPPEYRDGMLDGIPEAGSFSPDPKSACIPFNSCLKGIYEQTRAPTSGQQGLRGVTGSPGFLGMKGGNSGKFNLVSNKSNLNFIDVRVVPGTGSDGGEGGEGGPGTPGGKISCISLYKITVFRSYGDGRNPLAEQQIYSTDSNWVYVTTHDYRYLHPEAVTDYCAQNGITAGSPGASGLQGATGSRGIDGTAETSKYIDVEDQLKSLEFAGN